MNPLAGNPPTSRTVHPWVVVTALLAAATVGGLLLDRHVSLTSQAMLYVLAVVISSYTLSLWPSVICALASVTALNFFFVPPRWTFEVESREHLISLFTMLLVALVISHLAAGLRRKSELADLSATRAHRLQMLATGLADISLAQAVVEKGQRALDDAFGGPNTLATRRDDGSLVVSSGEPENLLDGLMSCMREGAALGPGTGRWPGLNAWYIPLGTGEQVQGAVCIENVAAADTDGREHAEALCALLGQCLWRLKLTSAMKLSLAETQRQQVQSTYLAAISHDLRTPLAAVLGAASALHSQGDKLGDAEKDRLLESIIRETGYLSTVTENTLQLVHLSNAGQFVVRGWESMEEIVGAVLSRVRQRDTSRRITSKVPEGLPLIEADPVLISQLVANLLDNALKYSEGPINLVVSVTPLRLELSIKDRGTEIPLEQHAIIFQPYARSDRSGQRVAGLGLALCRAIASAHGGELTLRSRKGGGNSFTFSMPVNPLQPRLDLV